MWTKLILLAAIFVGVQHVNDFRVRIVTDALSEFTSAIDTFLAGSGLS